MYKNMTDWDLMTPGIGLTSIGIVGVGISLSGIAKTFLDGMHAVSLLTMFIGMIFLASGLFKDGFPTSGRAKSATFITLGFLVTFGFAAAVTVSTQVPSIFAYIGLMLIISIPATVLAVASYRGAQYLKPMAVIFVSAAIVGGSTFYAFGLVTPKPPEIEEEQEETAGTSANETSSAAAPPANVVSARILAGASAEGNPDYEPDPITVQQGDGIEWVNEDNAPHTVTSSQEGVFDSGLMNPAASWVLNTAEISPAEYEYYCTLHPFMVATLVISSGGSSENQTSSNGTAGQGATMNNQSSTSTNSTAATESANSTAANTTTSSASITTASIAAGPSVTTSGQFYGPRNLDTNVGGMVNWVNGDNSAHSITS
jgi:plastocyanin